MSVFLKRDRPEDRGQCDWPPPPAAQIRPELPGANATALWSAACSRRSFGDLLEMRRQRRPADRWTLDGALASWKQGHADKLARARETRPRLP